MFPQIRHATPAAAYAKSAHRDWENDSVTPKGCVDIAHQLVHSDIGKKMQVYVRHNKNFPNNFFFCNFGAPYLILHDLIINFDNLCS